MTKFQTVCLVIGCIFTGYAIGFAHSTSKWRPIVNDYREMTKEWKILGEKEFLPNAPQLPPMEGDLGDVI